MATHTAGPAGRGARGVRLAFPAGGLGLIVGALTLSWVAAFAWWWLLPPSRTVELTIPAGTAALVAAGESAPALPQALALRLGDTLEVQNLDVAVHRIGPVWIAAGARERTAVTAAFIGGGQVICTVHPAGALSVVPRSRPGIAITIPVALMAGIPMGLAALLAAAIAGRLDTRDARREPAA